MHDKSHDGMHCGEFEVLLAEAIDGVLAAPARAAFEAHAAACPACGPMLADAQAGLRWLKSLDEVEPPRHLVHNILAATTGVEERTETIAARKPWWEMLGGWLPSLRPVYATLRQPRFALTFAMAFFSLSVVLTSAFDIRDLRHLDLRPATVRNGMVRGFYQTRASVVRYYDNLRFLQRFEAQVRELKNAAESGQQPADDKSRQRRQRREDNTSGEPDKRYENYSREENGVLLARLNPLPIGDLMLHRRTA